MFEYWIKNTLFKRNAHHHHQYLLRQHMTFFCVLFWWKWKFNFVDIDLSSFKYCSLFALLYFSNYRNVSPFSFHGSTEWIPPIWLKLAFGNNRCFLTSQLQIIYYQVIFIYFNLNEKCYGERYKSQSYFLGKFIKQ